MDAKATIGVVRIVYFDTMVIRPAQPQDSKFVKDLLAQLGYSDLSLDDVDEKIKSHTLPGYAMLVIEDNGVVVGFIALHWFELAHWKGKMGRITSFCIEEKVRSQGIGLSLLKAGEEILREAGCAKLEVTSNQRRQRAHEFYLKNGYVEDSKRFVKYL